MTEEELNKQEQKQSQSEIIGAIRDVDLAIDRIRESFALIFGLLEDRAHEWIDNYEAVQPSSSENHDGGGIEGLRTRHRLKVKPLWLVEREAIQSAIEASGGSVTRAAMLLEVAPSTLYRKLRSWGDD
jgi:DNA-binding NtrC family response regulator